MSRQAAASTVLAVLLGAIAGGCGDAPSGDAPSGDAPTGDGAVAARDSAPSTVSLDTAAPVPDSDGVFHGAFAYADSSGSRLLAVSELSHPDALLRGICQSGARLAVRFEGHQGKGEESSGRQTAWNFGNDEGELFRVVEGEARPDETCFLVGPDLLALAAPEVPRRPTDRRCDPLDSTRLGKARSRVVTSCTRLGILDDGTRVVVAVFAPRGDSALASLAIMDTAGLALLDFPAEQRPHGTWRVDDGGEFHPEHVDVLFVAGPPDRAMAVAWAGAEGESLMLAVAPDGSTTFEEVVRAYRYRVPR